MASCAAIASRALRGCESWIRWVERLKTRLEDPLPHLNEHGATTSIAHDAGTRRPRRIVWDVRNAEGWTCGFILGAIILIGFVSAFYSALMDVL